MKINDFSFLIGGEAGAGIARSGFLFAKACMRGGLHVFGTNDYQSLIRGGHNFYVVRILEQEVYSQVDYVNLLVALNAETAMRHKNELVSGGGIIYDEEDVVLNSEKLGTANLKLYPIPLRKIVVDQLKQPHNLIMRNTVALGAAIAVAYYDFILLAEILKETFKPEVAELNVNAAQTGYDYVKDRFENNFEFRLQKTASAGKRRIFLSGNEAVGLGAVKAGCKFYSGYPMTPTTGLLHFMTSNERNFNMIAMQPEGEIAAINMIAGAAFAGVRAMTATSGGGFCLMTEGLGMAGMTETPIVIMVGQRPGPSTGLPTYSAQGDLRFVIHAGQGEFPRMVIAPGDIEECFYETMRAFNWAEKYQIPVILLTDKHLAESEVSAEPFDTDRVKIERGSLITGQYEDTEEYRRYDVTETGVSPRALPSTKGAIVRANSDEHKKEGFTSEDPAVTTMMMDKRMRKLATIKKEIRERNVETTKFYGSEEAQATVISWGSTKGAVREAMKLLGDEGKAVNFLQVIYLQPFPKDRVTEVLSKAEKTIAVENNSTSQLASLIRDHTLRDVDHKILKYDGRPFNPIWLSERIKEVL
ncbi:MAG TPA: 2-oxoacid:acceptor oxidoreductase subunit alpha [Candidatus Bathyarchaeia archaeon]|jgi:2-oxoglutarate ferredoxin oxidoreductase subunit alpha|nr:2-oxoacid:acceptor oxidoreductase subunit alpha [Candidatus Bathyarchaeia archaeon]